MTAVHPPELCPVPDGECDEHLPADDGLRNVLAEMIAEGSDRSALLLGVLMSAAEYVVAAEAEGGARFDRELGRLAHRVQLVRDLMAGPQVVAVCACPGPCTGCPPLTSDEQADAEFRASRPMFEQVG